tara:strand:- start:276 stop:488 length:213 start_codon:yes stop_codon:yes gene_type:complete
MGILNKLQTDGSNLSGFDGETPPSSPSQAESTLHKTYSINGTPNIPGMPQPSQLDLDGVTPPKYLDNPPE